MTILNEIAEYTKVRIESEKKSIPLNEIRDLAEKIVKKVLTFTYLCDIFLISQENIRRKYT